MKMDIVTFKKNIAFQLTLRRRHYIFMTSQDWPVRRRGDV